MLKRRVRRLECFHRLLSFTASRVSYTAAPIQAILREAAQTEAPPWPFLPAVIQCPAEQFGAVWAKEIHRYGEQETLSSEDMALLSDFGALWGKVDLQSQQEAVSLYEERLEQCLSEARMAAKEKGRLYLSLGISGGLAAALLLLG